MDVELIQATERIAQDKIKQSPNGAKEVGKMFAKLEIVQDKRNGHTAIGQNWLDAVELLNVEPGVTERGKATKVTKT